MILVGNQRGGAKNLALHLLSEDNDHVRVHELRGFSSDNLVSALNEAYGVSRGTQCRQFLFSLSINPPPYEEVSTEEFERTIDRAEGELGLTGQPRAIVFHEKQGPEGTRRHAHAVWSRIDTEQMKAIQLSHTKRKLTALSRDLFLEHGYKMPRGLMSSEERDPRNFSYAQWQQSKRAKVQPHEIKSALQECWAVSDSRASFMQALETRGFKLARGDRRGFVAVDMRGEPYAISKWVGLRTKEVRARLGELDDKFAGVADRKREFAEQIASRLERLREIEDRRDAVEASRAARERAEIVERQRVERLAHEAGMKERSDREAAMRQSRFNTGFRGLLDRFTGRLAQLREENTRHAYESIMRDRRQRDAFIFSQMQERQAQECKRGATYSTFIERRTGLDTDISSIRDVNSVPPSAVPAAVDNDRERRRAEFNLKRQPQAQTRSLRRDFDR